MRYAITIVGERQPLSEEMSIQGRVARFTQALSSEGHEICCAYVQEVDEANLPKDAYVQVRPPEATEEW